VEMTGTGTPSAALLEQAEEAAARLTQVMTKLARMEESPLTGRTNREDRLMAATVILQETEAADQPAEGMGDRVHAVVVGALREENPRDESQWLCRVLTCARRYHPLWICPEFLQMPAEEMWELVALFDLCQGCLAPDHNTTVRTCPLRGELEGLCARPRCKQAHHQLLHVAGKQGPRPRRRPKQGAAAPSKAPPHQNNNAHGWSRPWSTPHKRRRSSW
jgi:hypothetical protein